MRNILALVVLACLFANSVTAQDSTQRNYMSLKISMNYNSGLNYYGRVDSLKSSGIFPMGELWFSPKVYVNAAPVFVRNKLSALEYAGSVTTLGYLHNTDRWLTHIYALKPFYKESSQLVQSALKVQSGASFTYLNNFVNITLGSDIKWSDRIEFGTMAGLDHVFRKEGRNQSVWIVNPSFYVNAGTQYFSTTYNKKKGRILPRQQQVIKQVQQFNILSYEASLPLIYSKDRLQVLLTPAFVIPQNLLQLPDQPELSEMGKNMFYTTFTVKYSCF